VQFYTKFPDGRVLLIPANVKPAHDHRFHYASGAQGGILGNYHFRIDFYREVIPPIDYIEKEGQLDAEEWAKRGFDRTIVTSVHIPLPAAKELVRWMEERLAEHEKQYGPIQLPKSAEDLPSSKEAANGSDQSS
jgi:hypothetical protein